MAGEGSERSRRERAAQHRTGRPRGLTHGWVIAVALLASGCPDLNREFQVPPPETPPVDPPPVDPRPLGASCAPGDPLVERCSIGRGPCAVSGPPSCVDGVVTCALDGPEPRDEICNLVDDDCDGRVDEALAEPCCAAPRPDVDEACNGADDDCDGVVDERVEHCIEGALVEACNGEDDDGDNRVDEDFPALGEPCVDGEGICRATGERICSATGDGVTCSASAGVPGVEDGTCDGFDDDCNGRVDDAPPCNGAPVGTEVIEPDFVPLGITRFPWVILPAGTYQRGSDLDVLPYERPAHQIRIDHHVMIASNEVTNAEWQALAPERPLPAAHVGCLDCPVERVNWYEAVWFANRVTEWHNAPPRNRGLTLCYTFGEDAQCHGADRIGNACPEDFRDECTGDFRCDTVQYVRDCTGYRLLTSAEWEAAARAGTEGLYWFDDVPDAISAYENCDRYGVPTEVPQARGANPFGLTHMLGNVAEWVFDGETDGADPNRDYDAAVEMMSEGVMLTNPVAEPSGPWPLGDEEPLRYFRGNSFRAGAEYCRATSRRLLPAEIKRSVLGFRLARTLPAAPAD